MSSKTRKVSFYRLSLEKQTLLPGTNTVQVKHLSDSDIEAYFQRICAEKMQALANEHKAMNITVSSSQYVIEVTTGTDTDDPVPDVVVNLFYLYQPERY